MTAVTPVDGLTVAQWTVWTTTARLVVTEPEALDPARAMVTTYLDEVDLAASRFRPDSEVSLLAKSTAAAHPVSPLLSGLVHAALDAARSTDGGVDPTLGQVLTHLGYGSSGPGSTSTPSPLPKFKLSVHRTATWHDVSVRDDILRMPPGTLLDLGATAKAHAADHCAVKIAAELGCGVLVSLGGDLRVAGPEPIGGWNVLVKDGEDEPESQIRLSGAQAVATSSTLHRVWRRRGRLMHHVIDPQTRASAAAVWRTVSVAAPTCLRANTLSTYGVVLGAAALEMLDAEGVAARLVDANGQAYTLGGWPS